MRWPDIFFKSRKPISLPGKDGLSKARIPSISELEKSVEPSPAQVAADKAAAESLRALKQKDSIRLNPPDSKAPSSSAGATAPVGDTTATTASIKPGDAPTDTASAGTAPFRRKAKLTDFARVLLPKSADDSLKTETPEPGTSSSQTNATPAAVVPAAFPVTGTAGNMMETKSDTPSKAESSTEASSPSATVAKAESIDSPEKEDRSPIIVAEPSKPSGESSAPANESSTHEGSLKDTTRVTLPESAVAPPKTRPVSAAIEPAKPSPDVREKREFILANGERILGHVLSETADTIYLDHHTLGVLTLPRTQIAGKPIEVILINGDRIVGDLIAETTECLYIRHASLGMVTVPHSQRSTRVVEAILKDGDRILGEVLAETDHFTVIRSATLGTVAVQHEQVAMLNRKIEQMQLRSLPAPALEDTKPGPTSS